MKIKYEFADGTVSEVEVEESIGAVIIEDRRLEDNLARKERYHCHSLDAYPGEQGARLFRRILYAAFHGFHIRIQRRLCRIPLRQQDGLRTDEAWGCMDL